MPNENDALRITEGCQCLMDVLESLPQDLRRGYRVELVMVDGPVQLHTGTDIPIGLEDTWILRVCLDPVYWHRLISKESKEMALENAFAFISISDKYTSSISHDDQHTPSSHFAQPRVCSAERRRELLILPRSSTIGKVSVHKNDDLVKWSGFWISALRIMDHLANSTLETPMVACKRVVFNFGMWETGISLSPDLSECHAHAHLWLTKEFVFQLQKNHHNPLANRLGKILNGHLFRPEEYVDINAKELKGEISFVGVASLRSDVASLRSDVASLRSDVASLLSDVVGDIAELKADMKTVLELLRNK
eukprot:gene2344-2668_t